MVSLSSKAAKLERFVKTANSEYSKAKVLICQGGENFWGKTVQLSRLLGTMILMWTRMIWALSLSCSEEWNTVNTRFT